jgi:hypothetical protein
VNSLAGPLLLKVCRKNEQASGDERTSMLDYILQVDKPVVCKLKTPASFCGRTPPIENEVAVYGVDIGMAAI